MTRRSRRLGTGFWLSLASVIAGLAFLAWPVITEIVIAERAQNSISEIEAVYDSMSDEEREQNLMQAHAWNDMLRGVATDVDLWDYDEQLTYHDEPSTMMSWIDMPKIGSHLPVYHHTTEAVLMAGVGHIDTTSLPVGGEGTLCALSGHSGMQNTRMFDDIRELEIGDEFVLWTLKEPYAYRVVSVDTVMPDDTSVLEAQPGRDLCALVTCTPINVNTHRLVVLGERCEYREDSANMSPSVVSVANRRTLPLIAGVFACAVVFGGIAVVALRRRRAGERGDA